VAGAGLSCGAGWARRPAALLDPAGFVDCVAFRSRLALAKGARDPSALLGFAAALAWWMEPEAPAPRLRLMPAAVTAVQTPSSPTTEQPARQEDQAGVARILLSSDWHIEPWYAADAHNTTPPCGAKVTRFCGASLLNMMRCADGATGLRTMPCTLSGKSDPPLDHATTHFEAFDRLQPVLPGDAPRSLFFSGDTQAHLFNWTMLGLRRSASQPFEFNFSQPFSMPAAISALMHQVFTMFIPRHFQPEHVYWGPGNHDGPEDCTFASNENHVQAASLAWARELVEAGIVTNDLGRTYENGTRDQLGFFMETGYYMKRFAALPAAQLYVIVTNTNLGLHNSRQMTAFAEDLAFVQTKQRPGGVGGGVYLIGHHPQTVGCLNEHGIFACGYDHFVPKHYQSLIRGVFAGHIHSNAKTNGTNHFTQVGSVDQGGSDSFFVASVTARHPYVAVDPATADLVQYQKVPHGHVSSVNNWQPNKTVPSRKSDDENGSLSRSTKWLGLVDVPVQIPAQKYESAGVSKFELKAHPDGHDDLSALKSDDLTSLTDRRLKVSAQRPRGDVGAVSSAVDESQTNDLGGCAGYGLAHSGCAPKNASEIQCASVVLKWRADGSGPPYGNRFMYDTGGRAISQSMFTTVAACALTCYGQSTCAGFVNVANGSCITVNDTAHAVGTGEVADSYDVRPEKGCVVDCGDRDGLVFGVALNGAQRRPVAAEGGRAQCEQYCDTAADKNQSACRGVVLSGEGGCWLADAAAVASAVHTVGTHQSWLKQVLPMATRPPALNSSNWWWWWIADASAHVFEDAEPYQSAYCRDGDAPHEIDWAAAPGMYVASQLVVKTDGGTPVKNVRVSITDLVSSDHSTKIDKAAVVISQLGLVHVNSSQLMYSNEIGTGWYPDILQPQIGSEDPDYQLAATGNQHQSGGADGFRFGFDTGERTLQTVVVQSLRTCQNACDADDMCNGVFYGASEIATDQSVACHLVNDTRQIVATSMRGLSFRRQRKGFGLRGAHARSAWIGLTLPNTTQPGSFTGSLTVHIGTEASGTEGTFSVPIALEVWPIEFSCIQQQRQGFGRAFGFDHYAIGELYPASASARMEEFARFTEARHIPSNSLTGWSTSPPETSSEAQTAVPPGTGHNPSSMSESAIRRMLRSQHLFPAAELGITPRNPNASAIDAAWVKTKLDTIAPRMAQLAAWGLLNQSYIYAFDEATSDYEDGIKLLFGSIKARWPSVKTLAVLNWSTDKLVQFIDVWVVQYQYLLRADLSAAKDIFLKGGKMVWVSLAVVPTVTRCTASAAAACRTCCCQ
jgi:hypothetical protein